MKPRNMVDERFSLMSLVFRLAGEPSYRVTKTKYQRKLNRTFATFKNHPAIRCASGLTMAGDQVFSFAMHLVKEENCFRLSDIESLVSDAKWHWNRETAAEFLPLLNDFYADTEFGNFFDEHTAFYEQVTMRFVEKHYSRVDLEWFRKYVDPAQLCCIFNPSAAYVSFGLTMGDAVYAGVAQLADSAVIVHEYCHHFANPLAEKWYAQDPAFKKLCDDPASKPVGYLSEGLVMAREYITRAYVILYQVQHGKRLPPLLRAEKANGFPFIKEAYAMIN